jgi:hypothetical protein
MLSSVRILALILTAFALFGYAHPAQAAEELLGESHPLTRNDVGMFHAGYSAGFGDSASGLRLQGDYFHWLYQSVWLDMQMALVSRSCISDPSACNRGYGTTLDIAVGAVWQFQTSSPIVPYLKVDAGPLLLFPQNKHGAAGILVRGGLGVHYYFWRWLGVGAEVTGAGGVAFIGLDGRDASGVGDVSATAGFALQY